MKRCILKRIHFLLQGCKKFLLMVVSILVPGLRESEFSAAVAGDIWPTPRCRPAACLNESDIFCFKRPLMTKFFNNIFVTFQQKVERLKKGGIVCFCLQWTICEPEALVTSLHACFSQKNDSFFFLDYFTLILSPLLKSCWNRGILATDDLIFYWFMWHSCNKLQSEKKICGCIWALCLTQM